MCSWAFATCRAKLPIAKLTDHLHQGSRLRMSVAIPPFSICTEERDVCTKVSLTCPHGLYRDNLLLRSRLRGLNGCHICMVYDSQADIGKLAHSNPFANRGGDVHEKHGGWEDRGIKSTWS